MSTQDIIRNPIPESQIKALEINISPITRFLKSDLFLRFLIIVFLAGSWQLFAVWYQNTTENGKTIIPTTVQLFAGMSDLLGITQNALQNLLIDPVNPENSTIINLENYPPFYKAIGLTILFLLSCSVIGTLLGFIFAGFSISTRIGRNFLELVAPPMSSLPAVALISAAILFFSNNIYSVSFVVINAVFWTVLAATHAGFSHVPETLRRVGQNYGLSAFTFVQKILFPAALPSILTGIRLGISRAFQAFVAVEMIIGAVTGEGALGAFIMTAKNNYIPALVYSGLLTLMIISYLLDNQIFSWVEKRTIAKWGMKTA